ncbi:Homeobox-leucine zipper protein PROTODERMAL FACTOR 2 [Spatholobus suberectus]|nr:Homeobox-leucine zipper protein PROTODERMAL FACTOR 2 [Spatholobus suberectus]
MYSVLKKEIVPAGKAMDLPILRINDSQVNSEIPALPPPKSANATSSAGSSSIQRNPNFYIERARDLFVAMSLYAEPTKSKVCELAYRSMDELSKIAAAGEPLWQPRKGHKFKTMNDTEYRKFFLPLGEEPINELQVDASQDMKIVKMNALDIVQLLMNVNEWSSTFYNMVSRGAFLGVFMSGVGGSYDGKLQVMTAEFQFPSPFLATRECYFGRYCKKFSNKMWGVVDFSLEKMFPDPNTNFRRRPSGCLIRQMSNEYCEVVIWVEHAIDTTSYNSQFRPVVYSGLAFGASRWLASLVRRIECSEPPTTMPIPYHERQTSLLNVAGRMMRSFCGDMNASSKNQWTSVSSLVGSQEVKIKVKDIIKDFGKPQGATVIFSTFVRLPTPPRLLFDFLRIPVSRLKWDKLSSQYSSIRELSSITQSNDPRNRVSIIELQNDGDGQFMFYLQESYLDTSTCSSHIVYFPIEKLALSNLLNGGNPLHVTIEPSGFTIVADGIDGDNNGNDGASGSILTITYSIMMSTTRTTPLIVSSEALARFIELCTCTINVIKGEVLRNNV